MLKDYEEYVPGKTPISARDMNTGGEVVRIIRNISIPGMMLDSTGLYVRPAKRGKGDAARIVKVTAAGGGRGMYTGPLVYFDVSGDVDPSGDIDDEFVYTEELGDDVIVGNRLEMNGGTLTLELNKWYLCHYEKTNSDGTQVWSTEGFQVFVCTPPTPP